VEVVDAHADLVLLVLMEYAEANLLQFAVMLANHVALEVYATAGRHVRAELVNAYLFLEQLVHAQIATME